MGLVISIVSHCDECICYHMKGCLNAGVTIDEIMETLKIGVIGGDSITYSNVRFAMHAFEEFTAGSALSQEEKLKE